MYVCYRISVDLCMTRHINIYTIMITFITNTTYADMLYKTCRLACCKRCSVWLIIQCIFASLCVIQWGMYMVCSGDTKDVFRVYEMYIVKCKCIVCTTFLQITPGPPNNSLLLNYSHVSVSVEIIIHLLFTEIRYAARIHFTTYYKSVNQGV